MTVLVGYLETIESTDDVLYYYQEKVIEQTDNWPALANAVKLTGRYEYPVRIRQILVNLVGNAIKFSNSGNVVVTVRLREQQDDAQVIDFAVADQGIGLTPEQQRILLRHEPALQRQRLRIGIGNRVRHDRVGEDGCATLVV
jgi:signal transduction histidine kinase